MHRNIIHAGRNTLPDMARHSIPIDFRLPMGHIDAMNDVVFGTDEWIGVGAQGLGGHFLAHARGVICILAATQNQKTQTDGPDKILLGVGENHGNQPREWSVAHQVRRVLRVKNYI